MPIRTCAGCRQERPKREMVRVVRGTDGAVAVDSTGKVSGRGTYICPRADCWNEALRTGSLARLLKTEISDFDRARLKRFAEDIPPTLEGGRP